MAELAAGRGEFFKKLQSAKRPGILILLKCNFNIDSIIVLYLLNCLVIILGVDQVQRGDGSAVLANLQTLASRIQSGLEDKSWKVILY